MKKKNRKRHYTPLRKRVYIKKYNRNRSDINITGTVQTEMRSKWIKKKV